MSMEQNSHEEHLLEIKRLRRELAQKEQEFEDLKMNHLFLKTVFDGINEEILVLDSDFNIRDVNRVFLDHYGLQKEEILGRKCHEIKARTGAPCRNRDQSCPLMKAMGSGHTPFFCHPCPHGYGPFPPAGLIPWPS